MGQKWLMQEKDAKCLEGQHKDKFTSFISETTRHCLYLGGVLYTGRKALPLTRKCQNTGLGGFSYSMETSVLPMS